MDSSIRKMMSITKNKKLFPTEKGKNVYPFIKRENDYSNIVALNGFTDMEVKTLFNLLQRVREMWKLIGILLKRKQKKLLII